MTQTSCDRIFYASQQVTVANCDNPLSFTAVRGAQSFGFSTDIPLESIQQLGCVEDYEQIEDTPEVEVTVEKVLDGTCPVFILATERNPAAGDEPTLVGRSTQSANLALSVFDADQDCADGPAKCWFAFEEQYPSSLSYTFGIDGAFTESVTFQGNNVLSSAQTGGNCPITNTGDLADLTTFGGVGAIVSGQFGATAVQAPPSGQFVNRKEHLNFDLITGIVGLDPNGAACAPDVTVLPPMLEGISANGLNERTNGDLNACIQSITVSVDLTREAIECLGTKAIACRYVDFPVEVTCEIEQLARDCPSISATENGIFTTATTSTACPTVNNNLKDNTIRIATCDGLRLYLGLKNKLQSANYSGGDTGGGNVTVSYTFRNSSFLTVLHEECAAEAVFWANRQTWLCDI